MLSKNNKKQYDLKHANGRQHFSLRKTTLGLASVLLSTTLYLGGNSGQLVHAAEDTNSTTVSSNSDAISTEEAKTTSVDKSALQNAYDNALNVQKSDVKYTNETDSTKKSAYDSAVANAKSVLDNASATSEDVTNAVNELNTAYNSLTGVANTTTTANDTTKTGAGLYSDEDKAKEQASNLTTESSTISRKLSTDFLKKYNVTNGDRYQVDPKDSGVFSSGNIDKWHAAVNTNNKYYNASATGNITITQADYNQNDNTITWTVTFNPNNGVSYSGSGSPAGTGAGGSGSGSFSTATSVYAISISKDLAVQSIKYGWNTLTDATENYNKSQASQSAVAITSSETNNAANEMTVTSGETTAYNSFKKALVSGPLFNYISNGDIGTNITFDPYQNGKTANSKKNSVGFTVQITTSVDTNNLGAFTGLVAGESYITPYLYSQMGDNAFKTPRVLGVYRAANINKGTEGITSEAIPVKVTYNGSETVPSDVTSITYTINKNADNLKKVNASKYANATNDSIQVTTNDWNKGYYDTESVSYPYYYDTNTLKDDLLNSNALSLSNISVNGSSSKIYNTSTSIQNGALVINITAWDQPATGKEITVEKGTTLTPDLVAEKSISNYKQLKAEGYTFSFNNDVDTSKEGTGNYGLLIKYPDYTEANKHNSVQSITVHVTDSNLDNAKKAANDAIDKLNNLNDAQKAIAKAAVKAATTVDAVTAAQTNATTTDTNMGNLSNDDNYKSAESIKQGSNYKNADTDLKKAYDDAVNEAKALLDKSTGTSTGDVSKDPVAVEAAKKKVDEALAALNGDSNLAKAKEEAKKAINQMGDLSDADKEAAKANVDKATEISNVNTAKSDAQDLNDAKKAAKEAIEQMSDLSDADKTAAKSNVDNATNIAGVNTAKQDAQDLNNAKKAAKEAIEQMGNLSDADKTAAKSNVDNATDIAGVNTAKQDAQDLNNAKKAAKEAIEQMSDLSDADKTAAKSNVDNATDIAGVNTAKQDAQDLNNAKKAAKEAIEQMSDLSDADKTAAKSNVDNATDIAGVNTAKQDAQDLNDAKKTAKEAINKLTNLNKAQKEAAIAQVNAAETVAEIQPIVETATALDGKMGDLKKAIEAADAKKSITAYTQASDTKDFDDALTAANTLNSDKGDNEDAAAVQAKIDALTNAKLDGDKQLQDAKDAAIAKINALENLNKAQKEAAIAQVNAAETVAEIQPIVDTATALDGKMGDLKKAIEAADAKKSTTAYTQASDTTAFDTALDNANTLNSDNGDNEDAEAVQAKIDALTNAKLDGEDQLAKAKSDAIDKINALTNLNKVQKEAAIAQVNAAETKDAIDPIVETATTLDGKMGDLKKAIEAADAKKSTTAYTQASDTTAFDTALDNANTLNSDKGDNEDAEAVQAKIDALTNANLDGDKQLQDAKDAAIAKINALENLNKAQKQAAIEAVNNATTVAEIQPIVDTVTTLDGKMGDLKKAIEAADAKKSTTAYTQASDTKDFDDALTAVNTLNSDNGDNEGAEAVQAKIDALNNAKLDGDKQLQDAKDAAIAKINALENLNKAQKEAAIAQVNAAETVAEIQPIVDTATTLDGKMSDLKKAIEAADAKKSTTAYTQASDTTAFDTALDNANTLNSDNGDNEDAEAVQAKIDALTNAKLDGEDQLAKAKSDAIDKINALTNLNKAQKEAAIAQVNAAETKDAIDPIVETATTLDGKMGDLKKAIEAADAKKSTTAYTQASDTKDFDDALTAANTLNSDNGDNEDAEAVQAKIDALTNAKLDGEDQLANAKNDAIDKINALTNLNKAQKQAAIEAVNNATTVAEIQPIVDTATALDGKMGDLKKAIEAADAKKSTTAYTQASDTTAFDTALDNANTLNSDNGDNEDAEAVQAKIDALTNAKLDGEDQLAKAKSDAIDKINALTNLNKVQKEAAIAQVNAAETKDAIDPIVETATTLDGKMGDLKKAIEAADAKKSTTAYTQASDTKDFDDALTAANTLNSDKGDNEDAEAVQAKIDALTNAKLDGEDQLAKAKSDAIDKINALTNLNKAQKEAAIAQVNAAETKDAIDPIVETATALDGKMSDLKKAIEAADAKKSTTAYTQASDTTAFDTALDNANTLNSDKGDNEDAEAVQAKIDALTNANLDGDKQLQDAKDAAIAKINALENLNKAQKQAAIEAVNNATTVAEIQPIVDTVTTLDGKMGDLKKAIEAADAKKSTTAYTQASDTKDFDDALTAVNTLNSDNGDNEGAEAVQAKIDALNNAKLDGDKQLQDAKDAAIAKINALENLNKAQKEAAIAQVNAAETVAEIQPIVDTATTLDGKMSDLKKAIEAADAKKSTTAYTQASDTTAFDTALDNANTLNSDNGDNEDAEAVQAKIDALTNAKLDGEDQLAKAKSDAIDKINALTNLNKAQKEAAIAQVNAAETKDAIDPIVETATTLDGKMGDLKKAIEAADAKKSTTAYTQASDTKDFDDALTAANTLNSDNGDNEDAEAVQAKIDALTNAKLDGEDQLANAKNDAIDKINALTNLNKAQKQAAIEAVNNATTVAEIQPIVDTATALDGKMGDLKKAIEAADAKKSTTAYTQASDTTAFDTALDNANTLNSDNGDNEDAEAVQAKIDALTNAKLDGEDQLAKAKSDAIDKINALTNLNKVQKEAAIAQVNAAETKDAIDPIVETATTLDGKMGDLKKAIEAADAKKSTTAYTQASDTKDFDDALTAANTLNSDKGDNEDAEAVQAKIDALTNAKLDGEDQLAKAKSDAIDKINALTNLNKAQKEAAIAQVNAAETKDAIDPIVETATALDGKMSDLKKAIEAADAKKSTTAYTQASDTTAFDTALDNANTLNSDKGDNEDAEAVQAKIDALTNANLDGDKQLQDAKDAAIAKINALENLNKAQKQAAIEAVNNATTVAEIQPIVETATALDGKMGDLKKAIEAADAKKSITAYTQASDTKDFDDALTAANTLNSDKGDNEDAAAVQAKIDALTNAKLDGDKQLQDAKDAAIAKINALENLNKAQKEAAIAQVNAAETVAEIQPIVDTATTLDGKMSDLKKAIEAADAKKSTTAYTQASDTTAFDTALDNANTLNSDNGDNEDAEAVQAKIDALTNAKLDGEDQLAKAKSDAIDKINALTNLNKAQKEAAIAQVNAAETKDAIDPIVETATTLDGKMGDLKKAIEAADAKKSTTAYTQASDTKDFDDALTAANTLNSDNGDNEDAEAVQAKIDALTNAKLDGEDQLANAKNDAIDKINALTNLNKAQKQAAIEAVNNATTVAEIQPIVDTATALDGKMGDLKKAIEAADAKKSTTAYTQASDTTAFDTALDNANTLNSDNGDNEDAEAVQAKIDALTNAKLDGEDQLAKAKSDAIDKINALTNLNKVQKEAAIAQVNAAETKDAIDPIVETATTLDGKMGDLKKAIEAADAKKSTTAYTQASDTKDFDDALTAANTLNSDKGDNEDAEAVQAKIDALTNAKLDGEDQLAKAKSDAIDKINALTNLNKAQKEAAIAQVNAAETKDAIDPIVETATALDGKMSDLKKAIEAADAKKSTTAYTQASDTTAFDTALDNANTLNSDKGDNEDAEAVQAKIDALTNANLDGDKQLQDAKDAAIAKINALENLNKAQKQAAIEAVNNATTVAEIQPIVETATALDGKMGDLKKAIEAADAKKSITAYTQASDTKDFDDALTAANTLNSDKGDNEDAAAVQAKIDALTNAKLDGDKQLQDAKDAAIAKINALENLNKAQKEAAIAQVNAAETVAEIQPIVDTATTLDGKMSDLKKAIEAADAKKSTTAYTQASDTTAFDTALDNANTLNSDNGDNEDAEAVQAKIDALTNAKLDGEDQLAKAKSDAIDKINALTNLNKAQKEAAIAQVNAAETKDAIDPIVETATTLDGKMGDLKKAIEAADAKKSTTAYTQASDTKDFDDALTAANTLNSDNGDNEDAEAVQAKIDALTNAKLDGEDQLANAKNDAIDKINALTNLNKAQKQAAIEAVNNATTVAEIQPIVDTATALDGKMGDLKKAIEAADAKKSTTAYTQASDTTAFDTALDNANTLNSDNGDNEDAEAVQAKIDALTNAKLDGEDQLAKAKSDAIDKINALTNLNKVQKEAAIAQVNAAETKDAIDPIVETATTLDGKMGDLKKAIEAADAKKSTTAYTQASDTKDFDDALTAANTLNSDKGDNEDAEAVQAKIDALTNAKLDGEDQLAKAKSDAIDKINALTNLNKAQKEAAIAQVNAAETKDAIDPIVETATALDGKMSDLKKAIEAADAKKSTTAYTQASDTTAFDTALDNANTLNSDKGDNEDAEAVQAKIDALTNANLDGDKQLQDAKDAAIAKINALENLNKAQKQAAIEAVNNATTVAEIQPIVDTVTTLDGKMGDLKKAIEAADAKKSTTAYTQASDTKDFDDALTAVNTLNSDNGDNEGAEAVQAKIDALNNAKLNGERIALQKAVEVAIAKIEGINPDYIYYNSDSELQSAFKEAVAKGKILLEQRDASDENYQLAREAIEAAMKALNGQLTDKTALQTSVSQSGEVHKSVAYLNASEAAKKAYDDALANAEAVLADKNATQADVDAALAKLNAVLQKLDGKESPAKPTVKKNTVKLGTNADRLPQTGSHESVASEVGLGILALGLAALGLVKKRKED